MPALRFIAPLVALALDMSMATAAPAADRAKLWKVCAGDDSDLGLAACMAIVGTPGIPPKERAAAAHSRCYKFVIRHDFRSALTSCDYALQYDAMTYDAWLGRSLVRSALGQFDLAIADASRALAIATNDADRASALQNRAAANVRFGRAAEAAADIEQAIRLTPKDDYNIVIKADAAQQLGRPEEALALLARFPVVTTPGAPDWRKHSDIGVVRSKSLVALQRYSEVLPVLDALVKIDKNNAEAFALMSQAASHTGDFATARDALATARKLPLSSVDAAAAYREAEQLLRELDRASLAQTPPADPAAPGPAQGNRVALVIGNAAYKGVSPLQNAARDAEALAAELQALGFRKVTLLRDQTKDQMAAALRTFAKDAEGADWAVVYFAGHGLEMGGVNWLVPVDAQLKTDRDVRLEAVSMEDLNVAVEGARGLRLIVLDACRTNPFAPTMRLTNATRSLGQGLARIEPEGGTLVAYAAKAGQVAQDGPDGHSPFVRALLRRMKQPDLEISMLFRFVRDDVLAATGRQQEPFVYGSLPSEPFYFRAAVKRDASAGSAAVR
jgi:tetratricopeptide (TPR) repeat protein